MKMLLCQLIANLFCLVMSTTSGNYSKRAVCVLVVAGVSTVSSANVVTTPSVSAVLKAPTLTAVTTPTLPMSTHGKDGEHMVKTPLLYKTREECAHMVEGITNPREDLQLNPDSFQDEFVDVFAGAYMRGIQDVNEPEGRVKVMMKIALSWIHPEAIWNGTECPESVYRRPIHDYWFPWFAVENAYDFPVDDRLWEATPVKIDPDGRFNVILTKTFDVMCSLDFGKFPKDTQICEVLLGMPETYNIVVEDCPDGPDESRPLTCFAINPHDFMPNAIWRIKNTSIAFQHHDPPEWDKLYFKFAMSRAFEFYEFQLLVPTIILTPLPILVFIVPTDSGEKMGLAVTILLAYFVMAMVFLEGLPLTADLPSLGWLYIYLMATTALSCFLAALCLRFHAKFADNRNYDSYKKVGKYCDIVCCSRPAATTSNGTDNLDSRLVDSEAHAACIEALINKRLGQVEIFNTFCLMLHIFLNICIPVPWFLQIAMM